MSESKTFHDHRAWDAFKKVRNRLRKHYPEELISACISHMMSPDANEPQRLRHYRPWELLLLIKWTLIYGDFESPNRRHVDERGFNQLNNLLYALSGAVRKPSEYEDIFLFLRNVAFQQFWLQEPSFLSQRLARQSIMFGTLDEKHLFHENFHDETGMRIQDFIGLGISLLVKFLTSKDIFLTEGWFSSVQRSYDAGVIECFLQTISRDLSFLRKYFRNNQQASRCISAEFYEWTPLRQFPLLRHDNRYYCYSRNLLFHGLQTYIYDRLRSKNPSGFMQEFGYIFEQYVEKALTYSGIPFINEKTMRKYIGKKGKIVDFLLVDDESNILMDAKGVEMGYMGMVSHDPDVVLSHTRNSILKAIEQGQDTIKALSQSNQIGDFRLGEKDFYLLVVTFKDLFVGNGHDFYHAIAKDALDEIMSRYRADCRIPFENMYFISIDDLDFYVRCVKEGKIGMAEGIKEAKEKDKDMGTKKFIFRDHIRSIDPEANIPEYLEDELGAVFDHVQIQIGRET